MTNQQPPELFPSERPVRSDFATIPRSYRIKRIVTCCVLALMVGGAGAGIYFINRGPTEVPTIKAEGPMKQKPEQPGGIDIPNQDVLAYQQIDNSADKTPQVEHLMPPPETPQAQPAAPAAAPSPPPPSKGQSIESLMAPSAPTNIPTTVMQKPKATADDAPTPDAAPRPEVTAADANQPAQPAEPQLTTPSIAEQAAKPPATNLAATTPPSAQAQDHPKNGNNAVKQASLPAASAMRSVQPSTPAKEEEKPSAPQKSGKFGYRIQLASFPDIETARHQMTRMEKRYSSQLGGAKIHIAKADLGHRGIYYRLQSNPITDAEAHDICKAINNKHKGSCIVVKP